jgi:hypothetical protein
MAWLQTGLDALRGAGEAAATVPPMDGALRPNTLLEAARVALRVESPDNLAVSGPDVFFTTGRDVCMLDAAAGTAKLVRRFDHSVTCLAANGSGLFAAGLADSSLVLWGQGRDDTNIVTLGGQPQAHATALTFENPATLLICVGSARHSAERWKHDLMQRGASGSVWTYSTADGSSRQLAGGLAFPNGLAVAEEGLVISESWRHRLSRLSGSAPAPILSDLPGYPSRLCKSANGGYWLCVFAPRSQLIEFVLREKDYRERMMRELNSDHWVCPTLAPAKSFLEPLQGGAIRTHGIIKPWAPTRSYGLLVRLDARLQPTASYHSRADGRHHGATSCVETGSRVLVTSKGGNAILALDPIASAAGAAG